MTHRQIFQIAVFTLGAFMVVLGGCAGTSPPSNFYVLSALPQSAAGTQSDSDKSRIAIGIGPVELPEYLDRSQIITRISPNELRVAAFERWAENLKSSFPRILMENLATLLNTNQVVLYPWRKSAPVKYQVMVEVVQFDAERGGDAVLIARWSILGDGGDKMYMLKRSTITVSPNTDDYADLVSAQSQTLAEFSREIAEAIKAISQ